MPRIKGFIFALILMASNPVFSKVEAADGLLLSSVTSAERSSLPPLFSHTQKPPQVEPVAEPLASLADAIILYEKIQHSERWQAIKAGPLLKQGDRHQQVSQLKGQLQLLGDLPPQNILSLASSYFDDELHAALIRFQSRHSVKTDGILGPQTRELLNVPPWRRIDQLALNMYRQKQVDINNEMYVHINLPEYRLRFYQYGEQLLDMRAVVGKRSRQTPEFSATVSRLVINPDWNVPKSIAYRDILPKLKDDPTFLEKRNLKVLSGWSVPRVEVPFNEIDRTQFYQGTDYYRFWEPPGESNTLGKMKFQLTADNSIYLHDTQQKYLFNAEKRAFSSGCVRLEDPRGLADVLVQVGNQWSPALLDPLFENKETIKLRLRNPVPVHVTYWTAWLDKMGVLHFANDMYLRDSVDFMAMQEAQKQVEMAANWSKTVQNE